MGNTKEYISDKINAVLQLIDKLQTTQIIELLTQMKEKEFISLLANLVHSRNNFNGEVVESTVELLIKLFEIPYNDVEFFYSHDLLDALKSQLFNRNVHLISKVC
jgi:hypothetical protein